MILKRFDFPLIVFSGLVFFTVHIDSAKAATMTKALGDSGWEIQFNDEQVKNFEFIPMQDKPKRGTLKIDKTWDKNLNYIDIKFIQKNNAVKDDFGLRITLEEKVINKSGSGWKGFTLDLIDANKELTEEQNDSVSDMHPGYAHFHKDQGQTFPPFEKIVPNPDQAGALQGNLITLSEGTFANKDEKQWKGIGIHQIEEETERRNFILRQTPVAVPEPLTMLGSATALGFGAFFKRKLKTSKYTEKKTTKVG